MDEELKSLQLDKPGRGKSVEDLRKHTLDAQFDNKPIERSMYLLTKGDDIQKLSVLQALPNLLHIDSQSTIARIIPKIQQQLPNSSCEFSVATSKIFTILMERKVPLNLLSAVLQGIDSRDMIVSNAWVETLLHVIPTLNENQIKSDIIPLAVTKSHLHQPVLSRVGSCKMLGAIAVHPKMQQMDVKRDILPVTQSLCQDCNQEVRAAMCTELPKIAQALGNNLVKANLLPILVELASDSNTNVRSAATVAVVQIFPCLTQDVIQSTIVPLIKQLCEKCIETRDITSGTVANEFGKILEGIKSCLAKTDCAWFLDVYNSLAHRGLTPVAGDVRKVDASQDVMCRQHCAFNLPAVTQWVLSETPGNIDQLYIIFRTLAADPCYIVRRTVAGCIHEIARILGQKNNLIKADVTRLLRDDSEEVLQLLVPQIGLTLQLLCTYGTLSKTAVSNYTVEIGRALIKCHIELTKGTNWRLLTHLLHQMEHLPECMPPDFIHQHFTPIILNIAVAGRAKPVRSQAVRTLLIFLRYNIKESQRNWLKDNLISQLCHNKSCYTRHIFIKLCIHALDIYSEKYFKEHFFEPLLSLAEDPVSNIRYSVVSLLPSLKQLLIMPEDKKLKILFDSILSKLHLQELDKDVKECLKSKLKEINLQSAQTKDKSSVEDKRKQDEEENILSGKIMAPVTNVAARQPSALENRMAGTRLSTPLSRQATKPVVRSASEPRKQVPSVVHTTSDMRFLEQHFYIDAGINLPTDTTLTQTAKISLESLNFPSQNISSVTDITNELNTVSLSDLEFTSNITDDAKATLQKLNSQSNVQTTTTQELRRNKRYSSVYSFDCIESQRKKTNRRSLNIPSTSSKETSRIPISLKSLEKQKSFSDKNEIEISQEVSITLNPTNVNNDKTHNKKVPTKLSDILGNKFDNKNLTEKQAEIKIDAVEIKGNIVQSTSSNSIKVSSITKKKTSNLPVLIK